MKKSRAFLFSRSLRLRLGNLFPRQWWSSSDCNWDGLSNEPAAANVMSADDVDRLEYARLNHTDSRRSPSFVREDSSMPRTAEVQPSLSATVPKMVTLKFLFGSPLTVLSRLKHSCGTLREAAKFSGLSVSELFVGNQMLMHVSAMPVAGRKTIDAEPSKGFVDQPERTSQIAIVSANTNTERER